MVLVKVVVGQLTAGIVPDHHLHYVFVRLLVFVLSGAVVSTQAIIAVIPATFDLDGTALDDYVVSGVCASGPANQRKGAQGQHSNGRQGDYQQT
jgi:hypothetical protein